MKQLLFAVALVCWGALSAVAQSPEEPLRVGTFRLDATPPLGSPLCDALVRPAARVDDPLSVRGVVILGAGKPIVLCAVDWVGIGNEGYDAWCEALARAAETTPDRVAVHCLHQHDAPGCDFLADRIAASAGLGGKLFHVLFARQTIQRTAQAVRRAAASAQPVTHLAYGKARVHKVASNRRLLGPEGRVRWVRYSSCRDEKVRAMPEGTIDPWCRLVAFFQGTRPLCVLTYYATHPQSYYGQGAISADFVGLARTLRQQAVPEALHIHFNGAGGNVAAGKYNDGSPRMRPILARRLAQGMAEAWHQALQNRVPVSARQLRWRTVQVALPPRMETLDEKKLLADLHNHKLPQRPRLRAARDLAWLRRCQAGHKITLSCLELGPVRLVHMPGELFVEYQLAAQKMCPQAMVCMAAYGDYGPGYIGTRESYSQGGYETSRVSRTAPEVEGVLMDGLRRLLQVADEP